MDSEAQGGVDWKWSRCLDAKFVVPGTKEEEKKWSPLRKAAVRRDQREGSHGGLELSPSKERRAKRSQKMQPDIFK